MDSIPKSVLDFWEAFDAVEPIGDRWIQTAQLSSQLELVLCKGLNGYTPRTIDDFMPTRYLREEKEKPMQTADDMQNIMKGLL